MSLRLVPRTLQLAKGGTSVHALRLRLAPCVRPYAAAATQPKENPTTSSAEQPSTASPPAPKEVPLTVKSHGPIKQNPKLAAQLSSTRIDAFRTILKDAGELAVLVDDDAKPYNVDWMNKYRGQGRVVLRPKTVQQVSDIMKYCNSENIAVVPQGGNTGLVGGSIPLFNEVVLSLQSLNSIRDFNPHSGVLTLDAGVILENADTYLAERGHLFPLDLGAKGSCCVGGNVATNAGGLRLLRYGSLHGTVLGLEVVLPDGTILEGLNGLRKDNTGYDLKQFFIGSEGTLGVITGISILCPPKPRAKNLAFLGLNEYPNILKAFLSAKEYLGEILSAFEFIDSRAMHHSLAHSGLSAPLEDTYKFNLVIETSGSNTDHDAAKLQDYLEHVLEKQIIQDGVLAESETQLKSLWSIREGVTEGLAHAGGGVYKYDLSVSLEHLYDLVEATRNRMKDVPGVIDVVGFGHIGDGNLHLNVIVEKYSPEIEKLLEPWLYEWIHDHKGSISAEHGLGIAKNKYLKYSKSRDNIEIMRRIKQLFDPKGLMNPYKYLPPKEE